MRGADAKKGIRADSRTGRGTKIRFEEARLLPWLLVRRNGHTSGTYNRLAADGRFSRQQIPSEVELRLGSFLLASGCSACQLVFGSTPADPFGRGTVMGI